MDELSSEPTRQRPSVCLFLCPEAPFFMDGSYRGSAVVFGKSSRKRIALKSPSAASERSRLRRPD